MNEVDEELSWQCECYIIIFLWEKSVKRKIKDC